MKQALFTIILLSATALFSVSCNDHFSDSDNKSNKFEGVPDIACMYIFMNNTNSDCVITWGRGLDNNPYWKETIPAKGHFITYDNNLYLATNASFGFLNGEKYYLDLKLEGISGSTWWDKLPNSVRKLSSFNGSYYHEVNVFLLSDVVAAAKEQEQ